MRARLIPDLEAGCSRSDSITADQLRNWKSRHPGSVTVMYFNTSAGVKADTDCCCTFIKRGQGRRAHPARARGSDTWFCSGPDMWLGSYCAT